MDNQMQNGLAGGRVLDEVSDISASLGVQRAERRGTNWRARDSEGVASHRQAGGCWKEAAPPDLTVI